MIFQRVSYFDTGGYLTHEWNGSVHWAQDRVKELDTLGYEGIDHDEVDIPLHNPSEFRHWLNNNPNSPNIKDGTVHTRIHPPGTKLDPIPAVAVPGAPFHPDNLLHTDAGFKPLDWPAVPPASALSTQEGGSHYKDKAIQPVEYCHANGIPFMEGSVIKYVTRHRSKNGAADIRKAIHFCQLILELEYGNND